MILTILLGLIGSFIPALPLMGIGSAFGALKGPVSEALASAGVSDVLISFICGVIIQSFSYIFQMLGFVFGVLLVFGLLEEVGVMARISYVFDNTMAKLGLQGKSVMPFLVSFGCTGCSSAAGGAACKGCLPDGGFKNMGQMWEVVSR